MTQEDRTLLLKDLSARLPYGVKCVSGVDDSTLIIEGINPNCNVASEVQVTYERSGINFDTKISSIKPYLFPLSSMNEEQKKEYNFWKHEVPVCYYEYGDVVEKVELLDSPESFEYLIENHFDYRGLIEKGLAVNAIGLNIY